LVNKNKSVCFRIYKYLQIYIYIYLFIDRLYKTIIYFLLIRYYRSSLTRSINLLKKEFYFRCFYLLYFFYITIIILLSHDLIEIRVMFRIKAFGTSIAGLIIIVIYNKNSRKGGSLVLFYDLPEI
jgi:hypothetical protein